MKKLLLFISLLIGTICSYSQDNILIDHIGIEDKPVGSILIKSKGASLIDSSSIDRDFVTIIDLKEDNYTIFKKLILQNKYLQDTAVSVNYGSFSVTLFKDSKKQKFYVSSLLSATFFSELLKQLELLQFESELISNLKRILYRIN